MFNSIVVHSTMKVRKSIRFGLSILVHQINNSHVIHISHAIHTFSFPFCEMNQNIKTLILIYYSRIVEKNESERERERLPSQMA